MIHAKWADSWRQIYTPYVNITGSWKRVKAVWTKVDGTWKQLYNECPTYFSVPNVSSSPTSRGYGTIHPEFGSTTMHNRNVSIPSAYVGYNIIGWTATIGFTMFNMDTASSSITNVTSGIRFTNSAGAYRDVNYAWPAFGSVVGTESGSNVIFAGYSGHFIGWHRWSTGGEPAAWYQNYFTAPVTQSFAALPITNGNLNIRTYAVYHARDWGLACYWQNMKLTLQNPHTGDTVALSFV